MNTKYKKYPNYIKIDELSSKEWKLTDPQLNLLMSLSREINENETRLLNALDEKSIIPVFLKQLLYFEQNRNSNIEGSQTQFDELFDVDRSFNDFMSWETRNLIDTALGLFKDIQNDTLAFNVDTIINLHKKLYLQVDNTMNIDAGEYLNKVRPGYILQKGDPINWIGRKTLNREQDLKNATLIPVIPEEKRNELNKLVARVRNHIDNKTLSILEISRFHVIFEGIHPFADGNGRLGRLLVLSLMQIIGLTKYTILPFSEIIYKEKDTYISNLNIAQIHGSIDTWNAYFIELLIKAKRVHQNIVNRSILIIEKYEYLRSNDNKWKVFLKFFKHIKLKKDITIIKLVSEGMSQATAYRLFDEISSEIKAEKQNDYFVFKEMWDVYKK